MNAEGRLRSALRESADTCDVDVNALYEATRARIDRQAAPKRGRTTVLVAASAAAVAGFAGGGLWVTGQLGGDSSPQVVGPHRVVEGAVDATFTCANTTVRDRHGGRINVSDPDLGRKGIERFEFVRRGEQGVLRAGLADGTLTARIRVRHREHWVVEQVVHCTGPEGSDVPVEGRFELGEHGRPFPEPPKIQADDEESVPAGSVQAIDDRAFYNEFGAIDRRTIFAYERAGDVVVRSTDGELDVYQYSGSNALGDGSTPHPSGFVYDVGREPGERARDFDFYLYYSTAAADVTAELKDGTTVGADEIRGDDWAGTLYAVLTPRHQVERVVVDGVAGTESYTLRDMNPAQFQR